MSSRPDALSEHTIITPITVIVALGLESKGELAEIEHHPLRLYCASLMSMRMYKMDEFVVFGKMREL